MNIGVQNLPVKETAMPALLVTHTRARAPEKLSAYAAAAAPTLAPFGGEVLHRGAYNSTMLGQAEPHGVGVIRFPDAQSANDWFTSPAYQAIAPLREEAAEMTFVLYDIAD
jgi:uncharacterized protein (DUF1330 family)